MYNTWTTPIPNDGLYGLDWAAKAATSTSPCTSWLGVTCTQGIVTGLELQGSYVSLTGPLPSAVSILTALTKLDCAGAHLSSSLPAQLSTLTALQLLYLGSVGISGPIPQQLSTMTSLKALSLNGNSLTGFVPQQLSTLSQLGVLILSNNPALTGTLPPTLSAIYAISSINGYIEINNNPAMCGDMSGFPRVEHSGSGLGTACTKSQGGHSCLEHECIAHALESPCQVQCCFHLNLKFQIDKHR